MRRAEGPGAAINAPILASAQIIASAAPGRTLDELEMAIHEEIARFALEGPTATELDRGRAQAETAFVFRLQSLGGFGGLFKALEDEAEGAGGLTGADHVGIEFAEM